MKSLFEEPSALKEARNAQNGLPLIVECLVFVAVFVVGTIVQSLAMMPVEIIILTKNPKFVAAANGGDYQKLTELSTQMTSSNLFMVIMLLGDIFLILVVWLFCRFIQKRKFRTLGFYKKDFLKEYAKGLGVGFAAFSAAVLICLVTGALTFTGFVPEFSIGIFLLFALGYMVQGMAEEVLCRGYFMISVARRSTIVAGIIANAVLFASLHLMNSGISPLAFLNLSLFGIFASVYFLKRGNIWGIGAFHSIWNLVQGNLYGIKVSGMTLNCSLLSSVSKENMSLINGGAFGLEGGLAVTIVLTLGVIFLYTRKTADTGREVLDDVQNNILEVENQTQEQDDIKIQ